MPSVENTVENTVENPIKRRPSGPSPSVFRQARHGNNDVTVLTRKNNPEFDRKSHHEVLHNGTRLALVRLSKRSVFLFTF